MTEAEHAAIQSEAQRLNIAMSQLCRALVLGAMQAGMSERFLRRMSDSITFTGFPGPNPANCWRRAQRGAWVHVDGRWSLRKSAAYLNLNSVTGDATDRNNWWQLCDDTGEHEPRPMAWGAKPAQRAAVEWIEVNT